MNESDAQSTDFEHLWDSRMDSLQNNFDTIKDDLPKSAVKFYENHMLLGQPVFCRSSNFSNEEYAFVIGKPKENKILFVSYDLMGLVQEEKFNGSGFASDEPVVWLYDEFHRRKDFFEHHIIFSDGISYIIPFKSMYVRCTSWLEES